MNKNGIEQNPHLWGWEDMIIEMLYFCVKIFFGSMILFAVWNSFTVVFLENLPRMCASVGL